MKKGFTIIELIAVITIIAVLIAVAFITISGAINSAKVKAYNQNIDKVIETTELYIANGNLDSPLAIGDTAEVTVEELITAGYLKAIKSPFDKSKTCNGYVLVERNEVDYEYIPHLNCAGNIEDSSQDALIASYNFNDKSQYRKNLMLNPTVNALPRLSASAQTISYGTAVASAERVMMETKSLRLAPSYLSPAQLNFSSSSLSGMQPGGTYTFSFYVYIPSSNDLSSIRIIWYDYAPTGNQNSSTYYYDADIPRDTWYRISGTRTLRSDTTSSFVYVYTYYNDYLSAVGQSIYMDAFQLEAGSIPTTYVKDSNNLVLYSDCSSIPRLSASALSYNWCTVACSTDRAYVGTKSLKVTKAIVAYAQYNLNSANLSGMVPGKENTLSFYIYIPEDNTAFTSFRFRWYDYSPTENYSTYYYLEDIPKGEWYRISATKKINLTSTRSYIYLYYNVANSVLTHNVPIYLDGFQLEAAAEPTEFMATSDDGKIIDYSINDNNITLGINTAYWVDTDNEREGFYDFYNSTKMFTPNNIAISGAQPRTIMGWINTRNGSVGTSNFSVMAAHGTSETGNDFSLGVQLNKIAVGYWGSYTVGNTTIDNNEWYHIAATYDGTKTRIYINGVLDGEQTVTINTPAGPIMIGDRANDAHTFDGYIDDVKVYGRALSQEEIKFFYESTR